MTTANPTPLPHDDTADPSFAPMQAKQLLVIDDDATLRTVIGSLARKLGYVTTDASTIVEASELIATRQFDCMTLDLNMGGQSGTELLEAINSKQSNVAVIVISSADDEERWEVLRLATLYGIRVTEVPKPLAIGKLREVFKELKDVT
jgi:CheY-like chemotaxis protein